MFEIAAAISNAEDYAQSSVPTYEFFEQVDGVRVVASFKRSQPEARREQFVPRVAFTSAQVNPLLDVVDALEREVMPPADYRSECSVGYVDDMIARHPRPDEVLSIPGRVFKAFVRDAGLTPVGGAVEYKQRTIWEGQVR